MNRTAAEKLDIKPFDPASYLKTQQDCADYLSAVIDEQDPALLAAALGDVARARGMSQIARATGLTREGLYKSLDARGNPSLGTALKVLHALGLSISIRPATA
jgi:probable addiction module antidote protein